MFDSHTEDDVLSPILEFILTRYTVTTMEIRMGVKKMLPLFPRDRDRANRRPNEQVIDQIIANALRPNQWLCREGMIERVDRGLFRITEKGREYLAERERVVQTMLDYLNKHYPGAFD
jgi:hypothetical protein